MSDEFLWTIVTQIPFCTRKYSYPQVGFWFYINGEKTSFYILNEQCIKAYFLPKYWEEGRLVYILLVLRWLGIHLQYLESTWLSSLENEQVRNCNILVVLLYLKFNEVNKITEFSLRGHMLSPVIKMLYFKLLTGHFLTPLATILCVSTNRNGLHYWEIIFQK